MSKKIEAAQEKLDALCKKHGIKPFRIDRERGGDWKKLVKAMCGIKPPKAKKAGRKKKYSDADILRIGQLIDIESSFGDIDKNGNEIKPPPMVKQLFVKGVQELDGEVTEEAIRGLWNRYLKIRKHEIEILSKEVHE